MFMHNNIIKFPIPKWSTFNARFLCVCAVSGLRARRYTFMPPACLLAWSRGFCCNCFCLKFYLFSSFWYLAYSQMAYKNADIGHTIHSSQSIVMCVCVFSLDSEWCLNIQWQLQFFTRYRMRYATLCAKSKKWERKKLKHRPRRLNMISDCAYVWAESYILIILNGKV